MQDAALATAGLLQGGDHLTVRISNEIGPAFGDADGLMLLPQLLNPALPPNLSTCSTTARLQPTLSGKVSTQGGCSREGGGGDTRAVRRSCPPTA